MNVAFVTLLGLQLLQVLCLELQDVIVCDWEEVTLNCEDDGSFIAIHEGRFTNNDTEGFPTCSHRSSPGDDTISNNTCTEDIRAILNYKCSGNMNCSLKLDQHHSLRKCKESGTLIISYGCEPTNKAHRFCNRVISDSEGYIKSPGYPAYYPGPMNCIWTIQAKVGQRVLVSILDLSMTDSLSTDDECPDRFILRDGQVELLKTCGEDVQTLRQYETESSNVSITLSSHMVGARRGILIWYKAIGCPTLPPPDHGYLVYRNISYAQYMCCTEHFFDDTLERTRNFHCLDGNRWNDTLTQCLDKKTLRETKNATIIDDEVEFETEVIKRIPVPETDLIFDILVPSIIMATLIIGNAFIVIILLKLRKSVKDDPDMDPGEMQPVTELQRRECSTRQTSLSGKDSSSIDKIVAPGIIPSTSQNRKSCLVTDV